MILMALGVGLAFRMQPEGRFVAHDAVPT